MTFKQHYYKLIARIFRKIVGAQGFAQERELLLEEFKSCDRLNELKNYEAILSNLVDRTLNKKEYKEGVDFNIYCISNRPALYKEVKSRLKPYEVKYFNGDGYPSFSKLVNDCANQCPTDIVIMTSDKMLPEPQHVIRLLTLLDLGFGFVGLHSFGFFGFRRSLFGINGPMDERFLGGETEDVDYFLRLKENNIAYYNARDLNHVGMKSSWRHDLAHKWFKEKWQEKNGIYVRKMGDEIYDYKWPENTVKYLDNKFSITKHR